MLSIEQIEDWLGQDALDVEGERVGKLDEVFYSTRGGTAVFALVKSGLLGRRASMVPLAGASVGRDYVRLAYPASQIERAGSEVNAKETLDLADARRLGELYGIELATDEEFESATVVNERLRATEEARKRAEELEDEAHERATAAQQAQSSAQDAQRDAADKAEQSERARVDAERARSEAERTDQPS